LQGEFEGLQKKFGNLKSAAAKIGKITHEFFFIINGLVLAEWGWGGSRIAQLPKSFFLGGKVENSNSLNRKWSIKLISSSSASSSNHGAEVCSN
jgi:hypothetical protein